MSHACCPAKHHKQRTNSSSFAKRGAGQELYLRFANIRVTIPNKAGDKVLIDNITAHAVSGRVLAIMGPSGAGKTTLLNALSARAVYAKVSDSSLCL